ncbi:MAG TPA: lytic transglycosylase domain-containing protein [Anaeromyxobacteraceae bacterium]|nr:lytic transglycosylase domain-containing protein [Anaeromyxobacteraceae bacterium]
MVRRRHADRGPRRPRRSAVPLAQLPLASRLFLAFLLAFALNTAWQLVRKPTEVLGVVVPPSPKTPEATWAEYGDLFREHSTDVISPALLAALVQVESAGDPVARTYWRWRWTWNPFEVYAPASSAVGILQITDGNFQDARKLCIHGHRVARDGSWLDPGACWFNALYFRTVPGDAIEMTSAWLHVGVVDALARAGVARATPEEQVRLAAVLHLCGRERGAAFARRGFRASPGERCGDHGVRDYVARVAALETLFARMDAAR